MEVTTSRGADSRELIDDEYYRTVMDSTLAAVVLDPALQMADEDEMMSDSSDVNLVAESLDDDDGMSDFIVDDDESLSYFDDDEEEAAASSCMSDEAQSGDDELRERMKSLFTQSGRRKKRPRDTDADSLDLPSSDDDGADDGTDAAMDAIVATMERASRDRRMMAARVRRGIVLRDSKRRRLHGPMAVPLSELHAPAIGLKSPLYFHQRTALAWMMLREILPYHGVRGGFLSDDMGVGKTLQMLTLIAMDKTIPNVTLLTNAALRDEPRFMPPTLVVMPASLLRTWVEQQRQHFAPEITKMVVLHTKHNSKWREMSAKKLATADVVLINYEGLRAMYRSMVKDVALAINNGRLRGAFATWLDRAGYVDLRKSLLKRQTISQDQVEKMLERVGSMQIVQDVMFGEGDPEETWKAREFLFFWRWRRVVYDECTKFKNAKTMNFKAVDMLQRERVWSLSGTPLENRMDEMYAHLWVLKIPQTMMNLKSLGKWHEFLSRTRHGTRVKIDERGATDHAITMLKRRILNVVQLRREIDTVNLVNPLLDYLVRLDQDDTLWDKYTRIRREIKAERSFQRRARQRARDGEGLAFTDRALEHHVEQRIRTTATDTEDVYLGSLEQEVRAKMLPGEVVRVNAMHARLVDGFYLGESPHAFRLAVARVDHWTTTIFGYSLHALNETSEDIRELARNLRNGSELDHATVNMIVRDRLGTRGGDAFRGLSVPKPLLFVARPSPLERAVYDHIVRSNDAALADNDLDPTNRVRVSFRAIISCRSICADYRFTSQARTFLDEHSDGRLWSAANEPSFTLPRPVTARDAVRAAAAATPTDDDVEDTVLLANPDVVRVPLRPPTRYLQLLEYLRHVPTDEKVVVMSEHVVFFPQLADFLCGYGFSVISVTGKTGDKDAALRKFADGNIQVLLGSLKALNMGLNLQKANHLILMMADFNGAAEEQAKRRIVRLGQKLKVHVAYMILADTIEELVVTRAGEKSDMITRTIGRTDDVVSTGSNFSRPDPTDALFMTFSEADYIHKKHPDTCERRPYAELLALPSVTLNHFTHIKSDKLFHATGGINTTEVARVLAAAQHQR